MYLGRQIDEYMSPLDNNRITAVISIFIMVNNELCIVTLVDYHKTERKNTLANVRVIGKTLLQFGCLEMIVSLSPGEIWRCGSKSSSKTKRLKFKCFTESLQHKRFQRHK